MDLKAKLEAVIYAAEEPVTLAQLAQLFADDALAWKAEQEAADSLPLLEELASEQPQALEESSSASNPDQSIVDTDSAPESANEFALTADPEAEAKRLARQRDREVRAILRQLLDELVQSCASDSRGIEI